MASEKETPKFHLPEDVTVGILSRLPVKSLLGFKCICREWRTLISSSYFTSMHLNDSLSNPSRQSILFDLRRDGKFIPFDPVTFSPRSNYLNACLDQACSFGDEMMMFVGSINGLLCMCAPRSDGWVCLWNPSTRMFRKIETPITRRRQKFTSVGFGFDPIASDYKVVFIYPIFTRGPKKTGLEVWSAKLESWRDIKVDSRFTPQKRFCDVIVNGFAYWIAQDDGLVHLVALFNMSTEVLQLVPMPHVSPKYIFDYSGFIWKGNFALATYNDLEKQYQAWAIENDTLGKEYWIKIFAFQLGPPGLSVGYPINFQNGILIYNWSAHNLIFYDLETRKVKKVKRPKDVLSEADHVLTSAHHYVESLISIKGFKPIVENAEKTKKRKRMFLYY